MKNIVEPLSKRTNTAKVLAYKQIDMKAIQQPNKYTKYNNNNLGPDMESEQ